MRRSTLGNSSVLGGLLGPMLLLGCQDATLVCQPGPDGTVEDECYEIGEFGSSTLAQETPEPAGDNCPEGGKRIDTGFDDNDNARLDANEVDSTIYVCDGEPGPTGATGPGGEPGPVGDAGAPGPAGELGAEGPQGPVGEAGPTGPTGAVGEDGDNGEVGPQGSQGPAGDEGPTGPAGAAGPEGDDGPTGATGVDGPEGDQGPTGAAGDDGATGATGETGATGATGEAVSSFCGASALANSIAIPILVVDTPQTVAGRFSQGAPPPCSGSAIASSAGDFTFLESGIYVLRLQVALQVPLAVVNITLKVIQDLGSLSPQVLGSVVYTYNESVLGTQQADGEFVLAVPDGTVVSPTIESNLLGVVNTSGMVSVQKVGEFLP